MRSNRISKIQEQNLRMFVFCSHDVVHAITIMLHSNDASKWRTIANKILFVFVRMQCRQCLDKPFSAKFIKDIFQVCIAQATASDLF